MAVFHSMGQRITLYLLSGHLQHRPYQPYRTSGRDRKRRHSSHSRQPLHSGTPEKIEHKGLCIVICIMSHSNLRITLGSAQLGEPSVAQLAGSHLDADSMLGSKGLGIKRPHMAPYPV